MCIYVPQVRSILRHSCLVRNKETSYETGEKPGKSITILVMTYIEEFVLLFCSNLLKYYKKGVPKLPDMLSFIFFTGRCQRAKKERETEKQRSIRSSEKKKEVEFKTEIEGRNKEIKCYRNAPKGKRKTMNKVYIIRTLKTVK